MVEGLTQPEQRAPGRLLATQRWAALATLRRGAPYVSMVAYVAEPDFGAVLLLLSRLARHTRNLLADGRAALVISEPDLGSGDPQTLGRLTLQGTVQPISDRATTEFKVAAERYSRRLPDALRLLSMEDFLFFRLRVEEAYYVGGFAVAATLDRAALMRLKIGD